MSKKAEVFQDVSTAIDLDCSGLHESAFVKYLECTQSLSTFLIEQSKANGYLCLDDNKKKAMKQVLSVIQDCVDRANAIFKSTALNDDETLDSMVRPTAPSPPPAYEEAVAVYKNSHDKLMTSDHILLQSSSTDSASSHVVQSSSNRYRSPAYIKMEKDNAMLLKKYELRIDQAKDQKAKQDLALELQRGITENLMIAQNKHSQILKQQQEERKAALEMRIQKFLASETCSNEKDEEKKNLYIEVLKHEEEQARVRNEIYISPDLPQSEVAEIIFQQTLKCATHPLTQWIILEQGKLRKQLLALLKDYSPYIPLLPEPITDDRVPNIIIYPAHTDVRLWELHRSLEQLTFVVRSVVESAVEILYTVYKDNLFDNAEMLAYRLTETLLILPLWPLIVVLVRITNLESELRLAETMLDCKKYRDQFAISCNISDYHLTSCSYSICELKKLTSLVSLCDKLSVLVRICQSICECGINPQQHLLDNRVEKRFGADDLVPILSYVCGLSGLPHLVSECRALDLLIHPRFLLGEEGYAVTSFQAALNYLEMKKYINPFSPDGVVSGASGRSGGSSMP